jgi:hypothetical protein
MLRHSVGLPFPQIASGESKNSNPLGSARRCPLWIRVELMCRPLTQAGNRSIAN